MAQTYRYRRIFLTVSLVVISLLALLVAAGACATEIDGDDAASLAESEAYGPVCEPAGISATMGPCRGL